MNQNQSNTSHLLEWLLSKRQEITSIGKDVDKREPSYTVGGNVNWYSDFGKTLETLPKIKSRTTSWSSYLTSGHLSKEYEKLNPESYIHPHLHRCIIYNSQDMETT